MEENGNFLHLSGVLTDNPVYGHEVFGEKFYYATLSVPRLSGAEDLLPITVSERLMDDTPLTIGSKLALDGQLRSYNKVIEGAGRLLITGFASHLKVGDKVTLLGRFQSRAYQKQLPDGTVIGKTAYEVSVGRLTMADAAPQPAPFVIHPEETHTVETLVQPSTPVQVNPFTTPTT